MKRFIIAILIVCIAGCTTLRPVAGVRADLEQRIASGELLTPGDRVKIRTADDKVHRFTVTSIDPKVIYGKRESVPIDQIVSIEKRYFDLEHTVQLVAVTLLGIAVIAVAVGLHHGVGLPGGG